MAQIRLHQDTALFRAAVEFTAAETGFATRLIEKDYFCTVVLQHLLPPTGDLVFKGGTCLAKVHAGFYRLSEDLDFVIPTPMEATRAERSSRARRLKAPVARLREVPGIRVKTPLAGANKSMQYVAVLGYSSPLSGEEETIKIEVGLREPLLTPAMAGDARTLLLDPIAAGELVARLPVRCLSRDETMAEKLRAALSRREPAIPGFLRR